MRVDQAMTSTVYTCFPSDSLNSAAKLMWDHDCGCIPIVDGMDKVLGILTDRDICMAAYFQGEALWRLRCDEAMSKRIYTVQADATVEDAEAIMQLRQVRRLPVTNADGRLVGILTLSNLARLAAQSKGRATISAESIKATLAAVSTLRAPAATPH